MKNFLMDKKTLIWFLVITILSIFVHFRNYHGLLNFSLDPPAHITEAKQIVESGKLNLVGPPITSKEVLGRVIFLGPFYYYVLEFLGVVLSWDIYLISIVFTSVWFATAIIIFAIIYKNFGGYLGLLFYSAVSFAPIFVVFSRQIWNLQFVPLFAALFLSFLLARSKKINLFWVGISLGLGFNVHYASIFWILIAIPFLLEDVRLKKFNLSGWLMIPLGVLAAEMPLLLFEIRHNFYNLRTVMFHLQYAEISAGYKFGLWYYYVLPLFPILVYFFCKFIHKVKNSNLYKISTTLIMIAVPLLFFDSLFFKGQETLHPPGWSIVAQKKVAAIIKEENENEFEVAQTITSDTRSQDLRWWLGQKGINVLDFKSYPSAKILYLVTTRSRPPEKEGVWEVSSFRPFEVVYEKELGEGLLLYKLSKK